MNVAVARTCLRTLRRLLQCSLHKHIRFFTTCSIHCMHYTTAAEPNTQMFVAADRWGYLVRHNGTALMGSQDAKGRRYRLGWTSAFAFWEYVSALTWFKKHYWQTSSDWRLPSFYFASAQTTTLLTLFCDCRDISIFFFFPILGLLFFFFSAQSVQMFQA